MSDTLNKDDINNNLEGDDIQKPLQNGNLSEKNGLEPKETENIKLNFQNNEPQPDATISNPDLPKSEYNSEPHDTEKTDVQNENTEKITTDEIQDSGTFDSKYQVNLIDERVLRVRTTTNQSVSIDCNVTVKEESVIFVIATLYGGYLYDKYPLYPTYPIPLKTINPNNTNNPFLTIFFQFHPFIFINIFLKKPLIPFTFVLLTLWRFSVSVYTESFDISSIKWCSDFKYLF